METLIYALTFGVEFGLMFALGQKIVQYFKNKKK